jgi:putative lumazine-binding protein
MRSTLALLVVAFALSSCAGAAPRDSARDFKGAERAVAQTVEDLEKAARDKDDKRLCTKLLSDSLLAAVEAAGSVCTTAASDAFHDAATADLTVKDVTISGDTATAKVTSGRGDDERTDTLVLEKAGAGWKITSMRS